MTMPKIAVLALALGLTVGATGAVSAQTAPEAAASAASVEPIIRTVVLAISERRVETPDDFVREFDEALKEIAAEEGLPEPASVGPRLLPLLRAAMPTVFPELRENFVSLAFSLATSPVPTNEQALAANPNALPPAQTEADCAAANPGNVIERFRLIERDGGRGDQCIRTFRVGEDSRYVTSWNLISTSSIDYPDRRVVAGIHFGAMGKDVAEVDAVTEPVKAQVIALGDAVADIALSSLKTP